MDAFRRLSYLFFQKNDAFGKKLSHFDIFWPILFLLMLSEMEPSVELVHIFEQKW